MSDDAAPSVRMLFATPLIRLKFGDAAFLAELSATAHARRAAGPGIARSNIGGWHSDTEMVKWGGKAARDLGLKALETCASFTTDVMLSKGALPRYEFGIEMWANISPAGASNQMHAHPGALWSAVYYVDDGGAPGDGALALLDPRYPMSRAHAPDLAFTAQDGLREETSVNVAPEPGVMLIFPAWLMHGVKPHTGPRDRISIAMNVIAMPARRGPA